MIKIGDFKKLAAFKPALEKLDKAVPAPTKVAVKTTTTTTVMADQKPAAKPVEKAVEPLPEESPKEALHRDVLSASLEASAQRSIITFVDELIESAFLMRASDIHADPEDSRLRIRLRIDGVLQDVCSIPHALHGEVVSRIKILAGLRTDEHQAAQDGRFRLATPGGQAVDVRVSIIPTYYGENAVLRLLADQAEDGELEDLGFGEAARQKILKAITKPYGMILATGPTGSGKTTTLYTLLKKLNVPDVSIITIEDPIEYAVPGINQIQVNPRTGLTFANGLRSILRQDPNVIMVGEIRDAETAGIAVNTALTGHLVLSTLHTNDAATTLPRLLDMKIEPFLIASTVNIAIGQRLVRRICDSCKQSRLATDAELKSLVGLIPESLLTPGQKFYHGAGCDKCNKTGYKGRIGIHEVLTIDNPIREAILRKAPASEIRTIAVQQGMTTILEDGFAKAQAGVTTIEEVLRMLYE
jgi:type IV pilus assembly protein PilB